MRAYTREEHRREELRRETVRREACKRENARKIRVTSLDVLLCVIAVLLVVNLVFMALGVEISALPKAVSVIWWSVVAFVVAVLASWEM